MSSSASSSSSSSDSESDHDSRQVHGEHDDHTDSEINEQEEEDVNSDGEINGEVEDSEPEEDAPVLSHAQQRKQKKKQLKAAASDNDTLDPSSKSKQKPTKVKNTAELAPSKVPKRQNSVWVGNLAFKTTPDALRRFFEGAGEITRVHMPMKMASAPGAGARRENRGFAYVDFATPDAKTGAITLSENPLDGRRLLIKDGDDFAGRPAPSTSAFTDPSSSTTTTGASGISHTSLAGHTKTAQKILRAQKQPAGPTLFLGNLGFEATEESIRGLFESHRSNAPAAKDTEGADGGEGAEGEPEGGVDGGKGKKKDPWIRKVRMGTFEDSGKCKGWAFVDFTSAEHATAALTNPRNHFLDGRKLVVEFASPDAVRRGGNIPRTPREGKDKKGRPEAGSGQGPRDRKRKAGHDAYDAGAGGKGGEQGGGASHPKRRKFVEDADDAMPARNYEGRGGKGGKPRARAKPGAALALAKRETAAIVPSQGKKIVF